MSACLLMNLSAFFLSANQVSICLTEDQIKLLVKALMSVDCSELKWFFPFQKCLGLQRVHFGGSKRLSEVANSFLPLMITKELLSVGFLKPFVSGSCTKLQVCLPCPASHQTVCQHHADCCALCHGFYSHSFWRLIKHFMKVPLKIKRMNTNFTIS